MSTTTKTADSAPAKDANNKNVIAGEVQPEKTVYEQAKAARKDDKKAGDGKDEKVDIKAALADYTDHQKSQDFAVKAKQDHLEAIGLSPEAASQTSSGMALVEPADTKDKMYTGIVTVTGTDGQYHQKISTRIDCTQTPRGQKWLEYAFATHFPSADLAAGITVDPKNEADPLLRTDYE